MQVESRRWYHHADSIGLLVWQVKILQFQGKTSTGVNVERTSPRSPISSSLASPPPLPPTGRWSGAGGFNSSTTTRPSSSGWSSTRPGGSSTLLRLPLNYCCAVLHLFNTTQVTKAVMAADRSRLVTGASGWTDYPVLHCVVSSVLYSAGQVGHLADGHVYPGPSNGGTRY